ncbi:MAG: restriction endonuclease [Verrucomicrobiaceae bacterium]|nr:restriction endonuclease [Verrucomicrobiaceae bacterium]
MALSLANYETKARKAVKSFWTGRDEARLKQAAFGRSDQGERAAVTAGKNMNGFISLMEDLVRGNGLKSADIHLSRRVLTLPGFFRPTKLWDMIVMDRGVLVAALEFKSQVGPSFGNNCNNRAEESIGTAHDFWTAYREGAFGDMPRPFLGWLMLVEDAEASRAPVRDYSPHFPVFPEFRNSSYLDRYHLLCKKLMHEQLYTTATVLASPRSSAKDGRFTCHDDMTSLSSFVSTFAGHIAAASARKG